MFGNRIEKSYDADGAGGGGATVTRFSYDGFKNVSAPTVGNEAWDIWADLNGSSSLTTRYLRGDLIDQVFARVDSGTTYWELTDRLGSIRDVVDNSAVVKDSITYNGFGGIASESDSNFRGRYAWTGREVEAEIDLQYNRARWYDANSGRWISQDPLGFDAGDGNLYRYVRNQATLGIDPGGLAGPTSQRRVEFWNWRISGAIADFDVPTVSAPYSSLAEFAKGQIVNSFGNYLNTWGMTVPQITEAGWLITESRADPTTTPVLKKGALTLVSYLFFLDWLICGPTDDIGLRQTVDFKSKVDGGKWIQKQREVLTPAVGNAWEVSRLHQNIGPFSSVLVYVDSPSALVVRQTPPKGVGGSGPFMYRMVEYQMIEIYNKVTGVVYDVEEFSFELYLTPLGADIHQWPNTSWPVDTYEFDNSIP